jgi:hypothetical protein
MQKEQDLKILEEELKPYKSLLGSVADTIMEQDVSSYPVFVLYRDSIEVGIPLDTENITGEWFVNASSLEEFVAKQLVLPEKVDDFKSVYKDPTAFLCLFVVDKSGATFVFIPRY